MGQIELKGIAKMKLYIFLLPLKEIENNQINNLHSRTCNSAERIASNGRCFLSVRLHVAFLTKYQASHHSWREYHSILKALFSISRFLFQYKYFFLFFPHAMYEVKEQFYNLVIS